MTLIELVILIVAGFMVGFINTIAGGATVISLSVLMFLGLPANVANGTHRIAALFQTFTSTATFHKKHSLDFNKGLRMGIPVAAGSIIGAFIAVDIDEETFRKAVGFVLIIMVFALIFSPKKFLKANEELIRKKIGPKQYFVFFLLGIYGGFIHIGIGYFLLVGIVLMGGYELVRANAIKVMIVFMYVFFALGIFLLHGLVNLKFGLILAVGQMAGAFTGARFAVKWGANIVRWMMVVIILFLMGHYLGVLDVSGLLSN